LSEKQNPLAIPETVMQGWQELLNLMAEIIGIPAALIMRLTDDYIEVFVSSSTENNPYHPGDKEHLLNSGLYCETVIKNKEKLLVPNALKDEKWKNNPDVKEFYLGVTQGGGRKSFKEIKSYKRRKRWM